MDDNARRIPLPARAITRARRRRVLGLAVLAGLTAASLVGARALRRPANGPVVSTVFLDQTMGPVAIDPRTGHAFVLTWGAGPAHLTILDTHTGALVRTLAVGSTPAGGVGALGVDSSAGHVLAAVAGDAAAGTVASVTTLDARGGTVLDRVAIPSSPLALMVDERAHRAVVAGMGAVTAAGTQADTESALDTRTGRLLRAVRTPTRGDTTVVAVDARAGRTLIFTRRDDRPSSRLDVIATGTGRRVARRDQPLAPWTAAVDEVTHRAFTLAGRDVAVYDTRTGRLVRRVPMGAGAAVAVDAGTQRVFVARAPFIAGVGGAIMVLDAADGRVLRTLAVGGNPTTLTLDARRDRVLVTDAGRLDGAGVVSGSGRLLVLDGHGGADVRAIPLAGVPGEVAVDERTGRVVVGSGALPGVTITDPWVGLRAGLRRGLPFLQLSLPQPRTVGGSVSLLDLAR